MQLVKPMERVGEAGERLERCLVATYATTTATPKYAGGEQDEDDDNHQRDHEQRVPVHNEMLAAEGGKRHD
jgi:hypothetical protein